MTTQALTNADAPNMPGAHGFLVELADAYRSYDRAMTSPLRRGTGAIFGVYTTGMALGVGFGGGSNAGLGFGGLPGHDVDVSRRVVDGHHRRD
jgi:hypothetical protein